jgi:hypothetical protein
MSWALAGAAILSGASSLVGGISGAKAAKKAAKAQQQLIQLESREQMVAMYKEAQQLLGVQRAGYAAAGVDVNVGSAKVIQDETKRNLTRANYYEAMKTQYLMKGAKDAGKAASSGYLTQGISGAASAAGDAYRGWKT